MVKKFNLIINWIGVIAFPLLFVLAIIDDGDSWTPSKWFYCMLLLIVAMDFLSDIVSDIVSDKNKSENEQIK